ncbi:MAG: hypothetical protein AB7G93_17920 [Bdellovibrionales bacterium]
MDRVLIVIFLFACGLLAWKYQGTKQDSPPAVQRHTAQTSKPPKVNIIYKLPPDEQKRMLAAVEHFCTKEYDRESCLHYLITCGTPCLVTVPMEFRPRIYEDYAAARQHAGLPPLPPRIDGEE